MSLKIVFMGTSEFSISTLDILKKSQFNILTAYTQPPQRSKRGQEIHPSAIEDYCKKNGINFRNPPSLSSEEEFENFKELFPDVVVVVSYGQIIPKNFLKIAKFGFINIHASLLPKWRGAAPIQRAIMNGDKKIGVSIMKIEEQLDSGPVLTSNELELDQNATHGEIEKKLSTMGAKLLIKSLKTIEVGNPKFIDQDHSQATYAKKIDKDETRINWSLEAGRVIAHIHGLSPYPGAWFEHKNERFKVLRANKSSASGNPGVLLDENLTIACKSDSIQILEIQRQGKKKQSAKEFLLGKKIGRGLILA